MIDIGQVLPLFIFQPLYREKVAVFDYQGLSPREDKGGQRLLSQQYRMIR